MGKGVLKGVGMVLRVLVLDEVVTLKLIVKSL